MFTNTICLYIIFVNMLLLFSIIKWFARINIFKFWFRLILNCFLSLFLFLVCDYEFVNQKFGWFTSPRFPKNYYENANCTYRIKTERNNAIQIQFTDFFLENRVNGEEIFPYWFFLWKLWIDDLKILLVGVLLIRSPFR